MVIVAIFKVRRSELESFREFESRAARIMLEHGGRLERTVVVDDGVSELFTEIHFVRFVNEAAFAAYRASSKLLADKALRDVSVAETTVFVGEDGPEYV